MSYFCITVRWFDDRYHGKDGQGRPEWPPSPLRLFQALVAAAYRKNAKTDSFLPSFRWLQSDEMPPPIIIAPPAQAGQPFNRFVPNNDSDAPGMLDRQKRLATKGVHPTLLLEQLPIHYAWRLRIPLANEARECAKKLSEIAQDVVAFGWGVDMATASGSILSETQFQKLLGDRWLPNENLSGVRRRVPCHNTLEALIERHDLFVNRLRNCENTRQAESFQTGYLSDLPPLNESSFRVVGYCRAYDAVRRPIAAFSLLKTDASGFRDFDPPRRSRTVAGLTRHVAQSVAKDAGWPDAKIKTFILGHGESPEGAGHTPVEGSRRFAYLPLPSIEPRGSGRPGVVGRIRRVLVTSFAEDCESEIGWARRALSNQVLVEENAKEPVALLSLIPETDSVVRNYTQRSSFWVTVTPVVLPGYDDPDHLRRRAKNDKLAPDQQRRILDRLSNRIDGLLRKAIRQAGFSDELAQRAEIEWRSAGFLPGTDLASRYGVPDYLKRFPRLHVRIAWRDMYSRPVEIPGPICIGGGRYFGLGLFAPMARTLDQQ